MKLVVLTLGLVFAPCSFSQTNAVPGDPVVVTGKLGINTNTPSTSFEIRAPHAGDNALIKVTDSSGGANWVFRYQDQDGGLRLRPSSPNYPFAVEGMLELKTRNIGDNTVLRISDSGGFLVWRLRYDDTTGSLRMTPSGGYPLHIDGDVYSNGVKLGPAGSVMQGQPGKDGTNGTNGTNGVNGTNGTNGVAGLTTIFQNISGSPVNVTCPQAYPNAVDAVCGTRTILNDITMTQYPNGQSPISYLTPSVNGATGVHCDLGGTSGQVFLRCAK